MPEMDVEPIKGGSNPHTMLGPEAALYTGGHVTTLSIAQLHNSTPPLQKGGGWGTVIFTAMPKVWPPSNS